jgi:hypothetical protein
MPDTITTKEAVGHMELLSQLLLFADFKAQEDGKRGRGVDYGAEVGQENSVKTRGMIYAFLNADEVSTYMARFRPVEKNNAFMDIFDPNFFLFLSDHLTDDHDRARAIICGDDGRYYFSLDSTISTSLDRVKDKLEKLVGDIWDEFPAVTKISSRMPTRSLSPHKIYSALLADAAHGHESMRSETMLSLPVAYGREVIAVRQRIVPQPEFDVEVPYIDPLTRDTRKAVHGRVTTGEILKLGPQGLEMRSLLRIKPDAEHWQTIDYVQRFSAFSGDHGPMLPPNKYGFERFSMPNQDPERPLQYVQRSGENTLVLVEELPVVMETHYYRYSEKEKRVVKRYEQPVYQPRNFVHALFNYYRNSLR